MSEVSAACALACDVLEGAAAGIAAPHEGGGEVLTSADVASASAEPNAASSSSTMPPPPPQSPQLAQLGDLVEGAPPGWTMTAKRVIFSPEMRFAGHWTGLGGKNISVKCAARDGKCNVVVSAAKFTIGQLVQWLAIAKDFPGRDRKGEHRAAWANIASAGNARDSVA